MKFSFGASAHSRLGVLLFGIVGLTGCTSSTIGTDRYARGQVRVVERRRIVLVDEAWAKQPYHAAG